MLGIVKIKFYKGYKLDVVDCSYTMNKVMELIDAGVAEGFSKTKKIYFNTKGEMELYQN